MKLKVNVINSKDIYCVTSGYKENETKTCPQVAYSEGFGRLRVKIWLQVFNY